MNRTTDPRTAEARRSLHSARWLLAWLECLHEGRPVSVIKTHWQLEGYLL